MNRKRITNRVEYARHLTDELGLALVDANPFTIARLADLLAETAAEIRDDVAPFTSYTFAGAK